MEPLTALFGLALGLFLLSSGGGAGQPDAMKQKIVRILAQIESGGMNYGVISIRSGKEFSYGLLQTRLQGGGIAKLINIYLQQPGAQYVSQLQPYLSMIQDDSYRSTLEQDDTFKGILKQAGADPAMVSAQMIYFVETYLKPAFDWATEKGFTLPVAFLVAADSQVHSGSANWAFKKAGITSFPVDGASEFDVLSEYLNWRKQWLNDIGIGYTSFRPELYLSLLQSDPNLTGPVEVKGTIIS